MSQSGAETVVHAFLLRDGTDPDALTTLGGSLYVATQYHGGHSGGTVVQLSTAGKEKVLHSFGAQGDGAQPSALIAVGNVLYGTTVEGGKNGLGTVFRLTLDGTETVVHNFERDDGCYPGGLLAMNGKLYGTTYECGAHNGGTVFEMAFDGRERVLHDFGKNSDGSNPNGGLVWANGAFYGVTFHGGGNPAMSSTAGTLYRVTTSGSERVVHAFGAGGDGVSPSGQLALQGSKLYGATYQGGANNTGTIFEVTP